MDHDHLSTPTFNRRRFLLSSLGMALLAGCGGTSTPVQPGMSTRQAADAAKSRGLVGCATGYIDASQLNVDVAGYRRQAGNDPLLASDPLLIGSNGKAMSAMTIACLVESGALAWDQRIGDVIPALVANMRPEYASVTLANLLDHRGGVLGFTGSTGEGELMLQDLLANPGALPDTAAGRRVYLADWVLRQAPPAGIVPGQDYYYSNAGYSIAAAMAETVTGRDFESLFDELIVQPLGLTVHWLMPSQLPASHPMGHEGLPGALVEQVAGDAFIETWMQTLAPSGSWACSAQSYARWLEVVSAALRNENTLLPAAAIQRLRQMQVGDYVLGWACQPWMDRQVLMHSGHEHGFMSLVAVEQSGLGAAFCLSNTAYMDEAGDSWVLTIMNDTLIELLKRYLRV